MKAFITSMGEPTTDLCKWSLERNGFDVMVVKSSTTLWEKLKWIYENADADFLRVDADVIPNRKIKPDYPLDSDNYWFQFLTYDWYKQDVTHGGVQFIRKAALPILRAHINEAKGLERPESYMYRIGEFHNPRRCISINDIVGLHGYGQRDLERVKSVKSDRNQLSNYDFELAKKLNKLIGG